MGKTFCIKDLIKYLIVFGLIYTILRMVPSDQLCTKDMILIMVVIGVGFISLDCMFKSNNTSEGFDTMDSLSNMISSLKNDIMMPSQMQPPAHLAQMPPQMPLPPHLAQMQMQPPAQMQMQPPAQMQMPLPPHLAQMQMQMPLPPHLAQMPLQKDDKLISANVPKPPLVLGSNEALSPLQVKQLQQAYPMEPKTACSAEIEDMKKQLESQISELKNQLQINSQKNITNDFRYNELPTNMFVPIGDKVANEWAIDNEYTILNTSQWQVPMPRPPVCINTQPCKVCPTEESAYGPLPLKNWDSARKLSDTKINQGWAANMTSA